MDIVGKIQNMSNTGKPSCTIKKDCTIISGQGGVVKVEKPFDAMNNIVANLLLNITRYHVPKKGEMLVLYSAVKV